MGLFSDILEAINDRGPLEPRPALLNAGQGAMAVGAIHRPVTFACPSCHQVYSTEQAREIHLIDHHAAGTFYVRVNDQVIPELIFLEEPCTDLRDGEARLIVSEQVRQGDRGSLRQHTVVRVPVSPDIRSTVRRRSR